MTESISTRRAAALALIVIASFAGPAERVGAQSGEWSQPELVESFTGEQADRVMSAATDASDRIHLFVPVSEGDTGTIQYLMWEDGTWTEPVDILARRAVRSPYMDIQAVWDGGRLIYLLQGDGSTHVADLSSTDTAAGWTSGPSFSESFMSGFHAIGNEGTLYITYVVIHDGAATLLFRTLDSEGLSPTVTIRALPTGRMADWPRMTLDSRGVLHAVWTELTAPSGWPPLGVYYSRSSDTGTTWSDPIELEAGLFDQVNVGVDGDGLVHAVWQGAVQQGGRYHRYSADGGLTWSPTVTITEEGFTTGLPTFAFDSAGATHVLFATERTVHTAWGLAGWQPLETIELTEQQVAERGGGDLTGEWPQIAITGGNTLHAIFKSAGAVWHSQKEVPAPEVAAAPTPGAVVPSSVTGPRAASSLAISSSVAVPSMTITAPTPTAIGRDVMYEKELGPVSTATNPAAIVGALCAAAVVAVALARRRTS